jgi:hypothetical protein
MTLFRFIGDPRQDGQGADRIEAFGLSFDRVNATAVADAHVIAKLEGNPHFVAVEAEAAPAREVPPAPVEPHESRKRKPRRMPAGARAAAGVRAAAGGAT